MARISKDFSSADLVGLFNKTASKIDKTTQDAIFNDSTLFRELEAAGAIVKNVTGSDYTWPLEMDKNNSWGSRAWASPINLEQQDINRLASDTYGQASGAISLDEATMDLNAGPEAIVKYAMSQLSNLRKTAIDDVNTQAIVGTGAFPTMNGLSILIPEANTTGTLHGIDRAANTWWRNQAKASACSTTDAFGPICIKEIQELSALASGGQGKPVFKLGLCDDTTYANALYYMPSQGTMQNVIVANNGKGKIDFPSGSLNTGEQPIYMHNARLIWDHAAAADSIRLFNPEWVKMRVVKNGFFKVTPRQRSENSFSVRVLMGFHGQMFNMNPRRSAVLHDFNS